MRPTMRTPISGSCKLLRLSRNVRVRQASAAQSATTATAPAAKNMSAHVCTVPKASVESTSARQSASMMKRLASVRGGSTSGRAGGVGTGGAFVVALNVGAAVEALEIEVVIPDFAEERAQGLRAGRAIQAHDDRFILRARSEVERDLLPVVRP